MMTSTQRRTQDLCVCPILRLCCAVLRLLHIQDQIKNIAIKATHQVQEMTEGVIDKAKEMVGASDPTADQAKRSQHKAEVRCIDRHACV